MKCDQPSLWTRRLGLAAILTVWAVALPGAAQAQTVTATLPAGTEPHSVAINPATNKIYVANWGNMLDQPFPGTDPGNVTVIDGATNSITTLAKGTAPSAVAVNPLTNKIYVANRISNNVTVIDGATNATTNVNVGAGPSSVAVNPVTNKIYVANLGSNNVTVIDGATSVVTATVTAGTNPISVAVNPVTNRIYVANVNGGGSATVIDGSNNTVLATVATGLASFSVAVNPVTNKIYVANGATAGSVTVIDGVTNAPTNVPVGSAAHSVAVNTVTNKIYVASNLSAWVTVIDGNNNNSTTNVATPSGLYSVAVNPVTNQIYAVGVAGVTAIDGATNIPTNLTVGTNPESVAVNPVTNKIYTANEGSNNVTVIDGATNITATVSAGISPLSVAVNPVTNQIYLANNGSIPSGGSDPGSVMAIDGSTNTPTTVATPAGSSGPRSVAVNPLTNKTYVANQFSNNVTVIDSANGNSTTNVATGTGPRSVVVNPVTNKIYVGGTSVTVIDGATNTPTTLAAGANVLAVNPATNKIYGTTSGNTVTVIDGATNTVSATAPVGAEEPAALAVNPVTNKIYVGNPGEIDSGTVTVIDGSTATVTATVTVGVEPVAIAVNPLTNKIYVVNNGDGNPGSVTVIDGATATVTATVPVGSGPQTVAVNAVTNKIYVGNANSVTVIDGATNSTSSVTSGTTAEQIAVNPVTNKIYVADYGSGTTTSTVTVIDEQQVQPSLLTTSISALTDNQTTNPTPSFTFDATSTTVTVPDGVYYQVDTWQNAWSQATGSNPTFAGTLATLQPGFHILYAYAGDSQEATSTQAVSPLIGSIQAYGFVLLPPSVQVQVTVETSVAGRSFTVDGTPYTSTQTFTWTIGDHHTIATTSPQSGTVGTQYVFTQWSDGTTNLSDTITVPGAAATYTANFKTQYLLTTAVNPVNSGSATGGGIYYDAGTSAAINATPNTNYVFVNWSGPAASSSSASTSVPMSGPQSVTANFQLATVQVAVGTNPAGASFSVDSTTYTSAQSFTWVIGSPHTIATTSPQTIGSSTDLTFANWSDGGAISHQVTANTSTLSYTASFASVSATFQPVDTTTQGNWPGNYGQDGYIIANDANAAPTYATVSFPGASTYTWVASSADPRALLKNPTTTDRIASTYYATNTFTIDLALTGGPHQVALYLLDLDTTGRAETISILDPGNNNSVLDTRSFSGFHNGEYAIWNLQGHVLIQVTQTAGLNGVVSGLFFRTLNPVSPPAVTITSPAPGTVSGPVTITANAQSLVPIPPLSVSAATNASPIVLTVSDFSATGLSNGGVITVSGVGGNTAANGTWSNFTTPDSTHIILTGSSGNGSYTSGGTVTGSAKSSTVSIQSVQFLLDGANFGAPVTSGQGSNYSIPWATPTVSNGPHTIAAIALDTLGQSTTSAPVSVTVANSVPPPSGSVVFLRTDTSTQGNWKSNYGADGELIANDSSNAPFYATVGLGNALQWTWTASTADPRALTKYSSATDRIASAYYNTPSFTLDVNFVDNSPHQVALYLLDWDGGRIETVSILDANNNQVLDTHTLSNFNGGQYLVWNMQGHVLVKVQIVNGVSAAVSGIFFGTAGAVTAPPTVAITSPSPNAVLSGTTPLSATASSTVGIVSVQFVLDNTTNIGPAITSGPPYTYQWNTTVGISNGAHTLTAVATDALSQQTTSTGIPIMVNNAAPSTSAVFVAKDTATEGTWKTHYGSDGEIIANDSTNPPGYAVLNFNGAATWTWATNISDARALQQAVGSNRIASTSYASNSFSLDVNITDTNTHQLALYFLDWDDEGRAQTVTISDATTHATLSTQTIANFQNGSYLVWNIKGHVTIQFSRTAGQNAVVSGVFLAPGT